MLTRIFIILLSSTLAFSFSLQDRQDECSGLGGVCQDWRYEVCTAGYQTGICPGDSNIKCCLPCDQACQDAEDSYNDSACSSQGGTCMLNSNYCDGVYTSGKCGGPSNRQCCQQPSGSCPRMISRSEWGARQPTGSSYISDDRLYQFVHHSETPGCYDQEECSARVRSIQDYHMDSNGWSDIGYSFLVGGDGNIYEGRGFNVQGAHTSGYNSVGYGTCFIGSFTNALPEAEAINIYFEYLQCAVDLGKVIPDYELYGHRQAGSTSCPGDALYELIQTWPHWTPGSPSK